MGSFPIIAPAAGGGDGIWGDSAADVCGGNNPAPIAFVCLARPYLPPSPGASLCPARSRPSPDAPAGLFYGLGLRQPPDDLAVALAWPAQCAGPLHEVVHQPDSDAAPGRRSGRAPGPHMAARRHKPRLPRRQARAYPTQPSGWGQCFVRGSITKAFCHERRSWGFCGACFGCQVQQEKAATPKGCSCSLPIIT